MKNKITLFVSFIAGIILLSACLKDKVGDYWNDELAGKMYATVPSYTLQQKALKPVAGDVAISFAVNIATDALPTEDITLTMAVDPAAIAKYNTDNKTSFKTFPTVQVLTATVVIPKGTRTGTVNAKVWGAETLDACDKFMTAISITAAKTASGKDVPIAGNMKSYLVSLPIANPYAGDYNLVGYRIRPGNPTELTEGVKTASTVDCKTIRKNGFGNYGAYDVTIEVTSNVIVVAGANCFKVIVRVIDPGTGAPIPGGEGMFTTFTGDVNANPKPATNDVNYYNPATKTFVLNAYYVSAAGNRIMYEVLTKK